MVTGATPDTNDFGIRVDNLLLENRVLLGEVGRLPDFSLHFRMCAAKFSQARVEEWIVREQSANVDYTPFLRGTVFEAEAHQLFEHRDSLIPGRQWACALG